jgi:hypothetical protein
MCVAPDRTRPMVGLLSSSTHIILVLESRKNKVIEASDNNKAMWRRISPSLSPSLITITSSALPSVTVGVCDAAIRDRSLYIIRCVHVDQLYIISSCQKIYLNYYLHVYHLSMCFYSDQFMVSTEFPKPAKLNITQN